jgi:hypothetical protein
MNNVLFTQEQVSWQFITILHHLFNPTFVFVHHLIDGKPQFKVLQHEGPCLLQYMHKLSWMQPTFHTSVDNKLILVHMLEYIICHQLMNLNKTIWERKNNILSFVNHIASSLNFGAPYAPCYWSLVCFCSSPSTSSLLYLAPVHGCSQKNQTQWYMTWCHKSWQMPIN